MKFAAFHRALAAVAGTALVSSALLLTASAPAPAGFHRTRTIPLFG